MNRCHFPVQWLVCGTLDDSLEWKQDTERELNVCFQRMLSRLGLLLIIETSAGLLLQQQAYTLLLLFPSQKQGAYLSAFSAGKPATSIRRAFQTFVLLYFTSSELLKLKVAIH